MHACMGGRAWEGVHGRACMGGRAWEGVCLRVMEVRSSHALNVRSMDAIKRACPPVSLWRVPFAAY